MLAFGFVTTVSSFCFYTTILCLSLCCSYFDSSCTSYQNYSFQAYERICAMQGLRSVFQLRAKNCAILGLRAKVRLPTLRSAILRLRNLRGTVHTATEQLHIHTFKNFDTIFRWSPSSISRSLLVSSFGSRDISFRADLECGPGVSSDD